VITSQVGISCDVPHLGVGRRNIASANLESTNTVLLLDKWRQGSVYW
jgi:hypothetical protein